MRQNILLAALSALTVAVSAQQSQGFDYEVDPATVEPGLKVSWCNAQYNTCRTLCGAGLTANDCDVETLEYTCTCSNGSAPGLQYYTQTIPTFLCDKAFENCIAANTESSREQDKCKSDIKSQCGTLDPSKAQTGGGGGSKTTTSSASSEPTATTSAAQEAPTTSTSTAGAAPTNAAFIGNGVAVVAAGVFAAML